jgi:hypothetical protein
MGLIDAIGVGLDRQHGRARVPGRGGRPDLAGGVAGEQALVGSLAPGLVHVAAVPRAGRGPVGAALVGGAVGVVCGGGQRPGQDAHQQAADRQGGLATPAAPAGPLVGAVQMSLLDRWLLSSRAWPRWRADLGPSLGQPGSWLKTADRWSDPAADIARSTAGARQLPEPTPHPDLPGRPVQVVVQAWWKARQQTRASLLEQGGELGSGQADIAREVLEPLGTVGRLPLWQQQFRPPLADVRLERGREVLMLVQPLGERDRVLDGQLRTRPDGEVGSVGGVPHQHEVPVGAIADCSRSGT